MEQGLAVRHVGTLLGVPCFVSAVELGSRSGLIGLVNLDVKCPGARSAGNPHATCDVAGAGIRFTVRLVRHDVADLSNGPPYGFRPLSIVISRDRVKGSEYIQRPSTMRKYLNPGNSPERGDPTQRWLTSLRNHAHAIVVCEPADPPLRRHRTPDGGPYQAFKDSRATRFRRKCGYGWQQRGTWNFAKLSSTETESQMTADQIVQGRVLAAAWKPKPAPKAEQQPQAGEGSPQKDGKPKS